MLAHDQAQTMKHTDVEFFFAGASTFLKHQKPSVKAVVVEPKEAPFLMEGKAGPHAIQGMTPGVTTCLPHILVSS